MEEWGQRSVLPHLYGASNASEKRPTSDLKRLLPWPLITTRNSPLAPGPWPLALHPLGTGRSNILHKKKIPRELTLSLWKGMKRSCCLWPSTDKLSKPLDRYETGTEMGLLPPHKTTTWPHHKMRERKGLALTANYQTALWLHRKVNEWDEATTSTNYNNYRTVVSCNWEWHNESAPSIPPALQNKIVEPLLPLLAFRQTKWSNRCSAHTQVRDEATASGPTKQNRQTTFQLTLKLEQD